MSNTSTNSPSRAEAALAIVTGVGWLSFFQLRPLECTCLYLCRESRRQVRRKVRVTQETPRSLWCCAADPSASDVGEGDAGVGGGGSGSNGGGGGGGRTEEFVVPPGGAGVTMGRKGAASAKGGADWNSDDVMNKKSARLSARGLGGVRQPLNSMARTSTSTTAAAGAVAAASCVPLARTTGVIWALPATELIAPGFRWLGGVKELQFWAKFDYSLERVHFPETLEVLSFGFWFDQSLEPGCVRWPPRLKRLTLGAKWNGSLRGARESWPASLEVLSFGSCFDTPLTGEGVGLPQGLREISLGGTFDQPLVGVDWPPLLHKLTLSDKFSQPLEGVVFPAALQEIVLRGVFNRDIGGVAWPEGLKILRLDGRFNQGFVSPDGIFSRSGEGDTAPVGPRHLLPAGLKKLYLGDAFDQPLSASELPDGLEVLVLGRSFSHVPSVVWPSRLLRLHLLCRWGMRRSEEIFFSDMFRDGEGGADLARRLFVGMPRNLEFFEVGDSFNSSLTMVAWPPSLKVLLLGSLFNRPIGRRTGGAELLPDGLVELRLGTAFDRALENVRLPAGLKRLIMDETSLFNQPVAGVSWPPGLEELKLGNVFNQPMEGSKFPETLRVLEFGWSFKYSLQSVALPDALTHLAFNARYPVSHVQGLNWPSSLRTLYVGSVRFGNRETLAEWAARRQIRAALVRFPAC